MLRGVLLDSEEVGLLWALSASLEERLSGIVDTLVKDSAGIAGLPEDRRFAPKEDLRLIKLACGGGSLRGILGPARLTLLAALLKGGL